MKYYSIFICSIALLCGFMSCDQPEITTTEEFDVYIQEEMTAQNIPALGALIFRGNSILHEGYYGQANIADNITLGANHPFLLASVSKVITATALLQLYDDGLVNLDDSINSYLPFDVQIPDYEDIPVTVKMLLTHTSAIADGPALDGEYFYGQDSPNDLAAFMQGYLTPSGINYDIDQNFHDCEPGTKAKYSNVGSALIAVLVENITGKSFNTYCKENIFTPLGMNNTAWRLDELSGDIVMPYNYTAGNHSAIGHYTFTDYPNGGLRSTPQDLHAFFQAFVLDGASNGYQLLEASTIADMQTLQISDIDNSTGLHMFVMNQANDLWGHDGGEQGVTTVVVFNNSTNVGAIILTNLTDANLDQIVEEAYLLGTRL